ncbi:MAG: hypothetical protein HY805_03250 [Nitrospirae bacterium]|nr:hypothetical protein [Nitrospirota bacterium]
MDNKGKIYFVNFEFVCGEYEQIFGKVFYAKDKEDLESKMHDYLINYYGSGNLAEVNSDVYYYWNGEVGVKCVRWSEIKSFKELVSELL